MTNKIVELNQKEILAVSGGNETIDSFVNYAGEKYDNIKKNVKETISHISEETWRHTIQPIITIGCFLFVAGVAYMKAITTPTPTKVKTS